MWRNRTRLRSAQRRLLTGEKPWERFEATVLVARTMVDMADAEAALVADCQSAGRDMDFVGASDEGLVRIYRVHDTPT